MRKAIRRTSIIATLGPRSSGRTIIHNLVSAGMDVARINFSHSNEREISALTRAVREAAERAGRPVAVMGDLPGPKLRVGELASGPVTIRRGDHIKVRNRPAASRQGEIGVSLTTLTRDVEPGHRLLIDDGRIRLTVESVKRDHLVCRTDSGGTITARRGVNFPDSRLSVPPLSARDRDWAKLAVRLDLDCLALSFVRHSDDIRLLQQHLGRLGREIPVIAKIERLEALEDLDGILEASAGVIVARGDLGVELPSEQVPVVQRHVLAAARRHLKPVIIATQMLESMIQSSMPTRAEVSDVAHAVFDAADALLLSGETAVGVDPVRVVRTMHRIALRAEKAVTPGIFSSEDGGTASPVAGVLARAAVEAALAVGARALVCCTESGRTAGLLSKFRPPIPILALAATRRTQRRLCLLWGVTPLLFVPGGTYDRTLADIRKFLRDRRLAAAGDVIVLVSATPIRRHAEADTVKILRIDAT